MTDDYTIERWIEYHERKGGDISEHLRTLKNYSSKCDHVTELGTRWVCSTWGLLAGGPARMVSYDINSIDPSMLAEMNRLAHMQGTEFEFRKENVLDTAIEDTDLLFIDTLHTYKQLKQELYLHGNRAKKYIIFHDTVTFGTVDEVDQKSEKKGLMPAIKEFLTENPRWVIEAHHQNNNGLLILKKQR